MKQMPNADRRETASSRGSTTSEGRGSGAEAKLRYLATCLRQHRDGEWVVALDAAEAADLMAWTEPELPLPTIHKALRGLMRAVSSSEVSGALINEEPAAWANIGDALADADAALRAGPPVLWWVGTCQPDPSALTAVLTLDWPEFEELRRAAGLKPYRERFHAKADGKVVLS